MRKSKDKYPGLTKNGDIKVRHELYEIDYVHKLNPKEKEWLNNFNLEYISGEFNHPGERLHKERTVHRKVKSTGKYRKFDLGKKEINDANNARNRDAFSITKANKILHGEKKMMNEQEKNVNMKTEDSLIRLLDIKNKLKIKKLRT